MVTFHFFNVQFGSIQPGTDILLSDVWVRDHKTMLSGPFTYVVHWLSSTYNYRCILRLVDPKFVILRISYQVCELRECYFESTVYTFDSIVHLQCTGYNV